MRQTGQTGELTEAFGACVTADRKVGFMPGMETRAEATYGVLTDIGAAVSSGDTSRVGEFKAAGDKLRQEAQKPGVGKCGPGAFNTGIKASP